MSEPEPVEADGEIVAWRCPECGTRRFTESKALGCCAESPEAPSERGKEPDLVDGNPALDVGGTGSPTGDFTLDDAPALAHNELPDGIDVWLAWKPEADGRKVPRAPWLTGGDAFVSAQDADVWTDLETVREWIATLPGYGPAINIRDREQHSDETLVLIDYDNARDPETERVHPTVREHVERADSYTDVSTSETGVHILVRGALPDGVKAVDAALPDDPEGGLDDAEIEVYDSGRFVAMTGDHLAETPTDVTDAQTLVEDLADEFATKAEGTPDELTRDPEKTREQLAGVETTDEIQDVFDAIQHTGPRDIRLRSPVTHERGDGSKSRDPAWRESKSGSGLAEVDGGWIERKGLHGLDALQVVALEDRIITRPDDYPTGETFWQAVDALRERGAHIPEYDGPEVSEAESVAILPNSPRAQAAANGWDWMSADRAGVDDALTIDDARKRTRGAIGDAYEHADRVLVEALPTMGKSYGAIAAAADADEPVTMLTTRGNREQYAQIEEWCEEHGLRAKVLPSFLRDCETADGEFGEGIAETVQEWYHRGATGKDIHIHYENETGRPIPCDGPAGARCSYKAGWQFDADDYDVLIGHYLHGHVSSVTNGRTVVFDEFPGGAFETVLGGDDPTQRDAPLAGPVTRYLKKAGDAVPYEDYADLFDGRDDPERRASALAHFENHDPNPDAAQAFDRDGHALAPLAAYTILAGAGDGNDLGNGWERASLPEPGSLGLFDRENGRVHLLRPPELDSRYTHGVVALDGTPTPQLWELALGTRLNHRSVLSDGERGEYLRDALGVNLVRTTENVKPYSSDPTRASVGTDDTGYVSVEKDAALLDGIADKHGERAALITTARAENVYDREGVIDRDADRAFVGSEYVSDIRHYGNLKGSNDLADCRLGAVIGSRSFGDGFVKKWGAFAGEAVEEPDRSSPTTRGVNLSFGGFGDRVLRHMREHETLQAVLRFGRDGGGATVYVHTNTLPEWVENGALAGEGRVLRTYSDGERQLLDALDSDALGEEWTTAELADHPDVGIGERQIRTHLHRLAERGYLSIDVEGNGFVWRDDGLHRLGEHGEVELGTAELDDLDDMESAELARSSNYTWDFRTSPWSRGASDAASADGSAPARSSADDGGDRPTDSTS